MGRLLPNRRIEPKPRARRVLLAITRIMIGLAFKSVAGALALVLGLCAGLFAYYSSGLPDLGSSLEHYEPPVVTTLYADDGAIVAEFFTERRYVVPFESVPKHVVDAFVASEDQSFYQHKGIDYSGILRALAHNILAGGLVEGGSTITQQLTRNLLAMRGRSLSRKVKEALLAYKIEKNLTKDQILYLYLNQIFLGHGAYGIEAAAQMYFGKSTPDLSVAEGALLAGLTPAPNKFSPYGDPRQSKNRQKHVLRRMVEDKYITAEQAESAWNEPLALQPLSRESIREGGYFVEQVRRYVEERYGAEKLHNEGLKVYTSMERELQAHAETVVRRGLKQLDREQGYRGPLRHLDTPEAIRVFVAELSAKPPGLSPGASLQGVVTSVDRKRGELGISLGSVEGRVVLKDHPWLRAAGQEETHKLFKVGDVLPLTLRKRGASAQGPIVLHLDPEPELQGALLALDVGSGEVRAMVGGYDFAKSQFNRALQARRQPGSAFKPIIYAAALEKGFTPSTVIYDTPVILPFRLGDDEEMWRPKNFGQDFNGPTTFREGLIHSRNILTVKILREIGVDAAIEYARKLGVTSPLDHHLSLALGSAVLTPLELSQPYLVFASGGKKMEPRYVRAVYDRRGQLLEGEDVIGHKKKTKVVDVGGELYEVKPSVGERVISSQIAYLVTHLLKEVVWFGTGNRATSLGRPVAGKTGTTNDTRDAWFVGYTPELLATVWIGHDDGRSMGRAATGSAYALPIWIDFMNKALEKRPAAEFEVPEGVVFTRIDAATGLRATDSSRKVVYEAYLQGTEPQEFSPDPDRVSPDKFYEMDLGL